MVPLKISGSATDELFIVKKNYEVFLCSNFHFDETFFNKMINFIINYQCAGKRTFATPKPNPNPKNKLLSNNPRSKVLKTQKTGCAYSAVNTIPRSHKSAKIAIFSCQKSRVPNKIEA